MTKYTIYDTIYISLWKGDDFMGLLVCPDCKSEVSDRLEACPKCGCPFTEEVKVNSQKTEEKSGEEEGIKKEDSSKKSWNLHFKKILIAVICIIIVIVLVGVTLFILNFKTMRLNKAKELINQTQYTEALAILEKYKDDENVKKLYEDTSYMISEEGQFLTDFAKGLMKRWDENSPTPSDSGQYVKQYTMLVNMELEGLEKYRDITFSDNVFNEKAHAYIDALDTQLASLEYYAVDQARSINEWNRAYKQRSLLVSFFLKNYPVQIEEKYNDIKEEFLTTSTAVSAQQELENQINTMIHENSFEKIKDNSGWKTYSMQIENKTDKTFEYFSLTINCLDENGSVLSQEHANQINFFEPGQKVTFEFTTQKNPASFTWKANYNIR